MLPQLRPVLTPTGRIAAPSRVLRDLFCSEALDKAAHKTNRSGQSTFILKKE
jgi:hypothetical protein